MKKFLLLALSLITLQFIMAQTAPTATTGSTGGVEDSDSVVNRTVNANVSTSSTNVLFQSHSL